MSEREEQATIPNLAQYLENLTNRSTHLTPISRPGMASQGSRIGARLAGAALGSAIAVKALDLQQPQEPEEKDTTTTTSTTSQERGRQWRRRRRWPGLLHHLRVVEVKGAQGMPALAPSDWPPWLPLPTPSPPPPAPSGGEEEEEQQPRSRPPPPLSEGEQEEQEQPPEPADSTPRPLVFVTAADGDGCLLYNLVEDALQGIGYGGSTGGGGGGGGPRIRVSFAPTAAGGRMEMRVLQSTGDGGMEEAKEDGDASLLTRLWEGLGLIGRPIVEPPPAPPPPPPQQQQQQREHGVSRSLAEIERLLLSFSSSSPDEARGMVVLDVSSLVATAPGTEEGRAAGATLRELFEWARAEPQQRQHVLFAASSPLALWKAQLLATGKGGLPSPEGVGKQEQEQEEEESVDGEGLLGAPVLHVQVEGMNRPLLDWIVSQAEAEKKGVAAAVPALPPPEPQETDSSGIDAAVDAAGGAEFESEDVANVAAGAAAEEAEAEVRQQPPMDLKAELAPLLRLGPRLDVLLDALQDGGAVGAKDAAVGREEARLLSALGAAEADVSEEDGGRGVLLWDVLGALHGERLDVVTRTRLGLGEPGTLPLETLVHLCSEEPDLLGKVEALMADGWLQVHHPGLGLASSPSASSGAGSPPPTTAEAPAVLCRAAAPEPLGGVRLPFTAATLVTTPALVTLAWRNVAPDTAVAARLNARSDARHLAQQAALLRGQRLALRAEWAHLRQGRAALEERQRELQPGDMAALQLELIRLEKAAASRAYEMRHRARHLGELRARLAEALPAAHVPAADVLAAPADDDHDAAAAAAAAGGLDAALMPPLSIEERVLLDVDRGLRAVPVERLISSFSSGGVQEEGEKEEEEEEGQKAGWWARAKGWGARLLPRGRARGGGGE